MALSGHDAKIWEPKLLSARSFEVASPLVRRCRHKVLHLAQHTPEARTVLTGFNRLGTTIVQT